MKIYIILLLHLFLQLNSLTANDPYDYPNTKKCLAVTPTEKKNCNDISKDYTQDGRDQEIACCYVTYSSSDEGKVEKCVPIFKTLNGLHMYEEQIKNVGGSSISIDCSSQKLFVSLLMIFTFAFLI